MIAAIAVGGALAWVSGKRVAMTDMPQMIALYNGMGGGAAAAIAAVELYGGAESTHRARAIAAIGGFIGSVSFSGSLIAFAKLQGLIKSPCASAARSSSICDPAGDGRRSASLVVVRRCMPGR